MRRHGVEEDAVHIEEDGTELRQCGLKATLLTVARERERISIHLYYL